MVGIQPNTTVIGRLRIRSNSPDPQAQQQRIARMLRSATLHPSGLPESAVLVVRRLDDPLPSRLRAGPRDLLPDPSWQRAVASALERLASSAARPAYGAVPANADAVLFYDRAEVLASLALDWMGGMLPVQWWWRELLRGRDAINGLLHEWIEAPQYVPGALDLLAQRKDVVRFVQRLPRQAVIEMLDAVRETYRVPRPAAADSVVPLISLETTEGPEPKAHRSKRQLRNPLREFSALLTRLVPEAANPGLAPAQRTLLAQALTLRRAPALARTVAFQTDLLRWEEALSDRRDRTESRDFVDDQPGFPLKVALGRSAAAAEPAQAESALEKETVQAAFDRGDEGEPILLQLTGAERHIEIENLSNKKLEHDQFHSGPQAPMPSAQEDLSIREVPSSRGIRDQEISSGPGLPGELAISVQEPGTESAPEPAITFETEYGGVFFLLGLALYLYIYGDFTSPAKPGLELNIWDFLSLIGSELTDAEVEKDPLWEQLALLAGRPRVMMPGLDFDPPDEWRLPAEWLEPFPEYYDLQPALSDGRLITKHPAGFIVRDVPASACTSGREEGISRADCLKRWVQWMAAYFRARLKRALGRDDATTLVCRRPATVVLTLTHVNVSFSLDNHPIELRMAGLDRDLGWIPAAGRYLSFHFR